MAKKYVISATTVLLLIFYIVSIECGINPSGLHENETMSCDEFSQFARFNPYSVLGSEWMVFYYWGPPQTPMFVKLIAPTAKQKAYLKYIVEGHVTEPIDWSAKSLLMIERDNSTYFLVEKNDRGHYYLYVPYRGLKEGDIIERLDIRIKQTGDNLYFGIMACKLQTVFMFARVNEVPKKDKIQEAAGRLGYRGRGGKSYLYQGHQWMPVPEADDWHFEQAMRYNDALPKINNNNL